MSIFKESFVSLWKQMNNVWDFAEKEQFRIYLETRGLRVDYYDIVRKETKRIRRKIYAKSLCWWAILQSLPVTFKGLGLVDYSWEYILIPSWVFLGVAIIITSLWLINAIGPNKHDFF